MLTFETAVIKHMNNVQLLLNKLICYVGALLELNSVRSETLLLAIFFGCDRCAFKYLSVISVQMLSPMFDCSFPLPEDIDKAK